MKTARIVPVLEHNEFMFDSDQDNEEVIMEFYNKRIKGKPKIERFKVYIEDDEDYDEENECYGISEYTIENDSIK